MNKQEFIKLLQSPDNISAIDLKMLEELAKTFPFCQAAHILIAKGNYDYGSMHTEQKIKKAALYTNNRRTLKHFIQKPGDLRLLDKPYSNRSISSNPEQILKNVHQTYSSTSITGPSKEEVSQELNESIENNDYATLIEKGNTKPENSRINDLIDKFIKEDPTISPLRPEKSGKLESENDLSDKSVIKFKSPVSETFANLLVKQGKIEKAIQVYEQLSLKYPEKKTYFASRIEELKNQ